MRLLRACILTLVAVIALPVLQAHASDQLIVLEGRAPFTPSAEDEDLNQRVIALLSSDNKIRGAISVTSHQGHVRLNGNLDGVAMIYRCVRLVEDMEGVKSVNIDDLEG